MAQSAFATGQFSEVAVVGVARDALVAQDLAHRLAEESYLGPGITQVVCVLVGSELKTILNGSQHPFVRRAFWLG
jgi:hypothetical protein